MNDKSHSFKIMVFVMSGCEPFICAVNGNVTVDILQDVERDIVENGFGSSDQCDGLYWVTADYTAGEFGPYGVCEVAPGYELSVDSFEPHQAGAP